ncbi:MAG: hypothetical protein V4805_13120 [Pseudomonadota bacterium]
MAQLIKMIGIFSFSLLPLVACDGHAATGSQSTYASDGITFNYPANWKIVKDEKNKFVHLIFVDSPQTAGFSITTSPKSSAESLSDYATDHSRRVAITMASSKINKPTLVTTATPAGTVITEKFTLHPDDDPINFIHEYRLVKSKQRVAHLVSKMPEDELENTAAGFALILKTFTLTDVDQAK